MSGRVVVTGAAGMLGRAMVAALSAAGWEVVALDRAALDVTDLAAVRGACAELKPAVVVNCAAYTDVDRAESEPERAMLVNALGARNLALACLDMGADLVQVSTDYVFSGQKGSPYEIWDPCDPINAYGKSKAWGEHYVRSLLNRHYIVRTSWLFGPGGRNFVATILKLAREREAVPVVDDQWGCPTFTEDLARATADLIRTRAYGTYHVTNSGPATWYELASTAVRLAGLPARVEPIPTSALARPAARPRYSVLDPFPLPHVLGYQLPHWRDALGRYLLCMGP